MPAMVVNDNAYKLDKRGALASIASKPAPTVSRDCVKNLFFVQNKPSLSGSSYSDGDQPGPLDLPGLPSVGSFSRHSTR